jgi:hypothetical protein
MTPTKLRNFKPSCLPDNPPIQKSIFVLHIFTFLVSRDTFVPTKIVLKVDFLERDFERDHLAEKSNRTKMGKTRLKILSFIKPREKMSKLSKRLFLQFLTCNS